MTRLESLLGQYAAYHLDRKNVFSHFIGIPLIVFSILCFAAKAQFTVAGYPIDLAMLLIVASVIYYLSLDLIFGVVMAVLFALIYQPATQVAALATSSWVLVSAGFFIVGWIIQFIGHYYEKKKPAFVDDLVGLAIGPLFVVAEFIFLVGLRKKLEEKVLVRAKQLRYDMDHKHVNHSSTSTQNP